MTAYPGQGNVSGSSDPLVEALLRELIDEAPRAKTAKKTLTDVLTEELLTSFKEEGRAPSQEASLETVILAEALAPALAKELAPALAKELAPALVKALQTVVAPRQTTQETTSDKGSE